jgi:protein-export membrane protein SecD/preprotein translocase SecF subunit
MMGKILPKLYFKMALVIILAVIGVIAIHPERITETGPDGKPLTHWVTRIPLGLDLKGGSELLYKIRTSEMSMADRKDVVQRTIEVIRRRVDPDGRMELDIRPRGEDRFYIQLPGMGAEESARIEALIRKAGQLRFCLVDERAEDQEAARLGDRVPNATPFLPARNPVTHQIDRDPEGRIRRWHKATFRDVKEMPADVSSRDWYLVENKAYVTGEWLSQAKGIIDPQTGMPTVAFEFHGKGRQDFERLTDQYQRTEQHPGRLLAIILDEDLYSAPEIHSRISGSGVITGSFTKQEVDDLVTTLRAGQLPADIELEWNNTVGAQLGEDSIRAGIQASLVGLVVVVAFMAVYYLVGGAIADFAVLVNLLLVLGGMAGMQSVLTLPGIAGLVLTLGMAVDANVLINERIREESQRGKTLRLAIRTGYERAFMVILDTHLTTIITALILFGVGTGPVRGFAITLILGLVLSLFTSFWVTRWLLDIVVEKGWLTKLHMMHLFGRPSIPFSKYRYICIAGTVFFGVAGLSIFLGRWKNEVDTELAGGFRAEMELKRSEPISDFRTRIGKLFPEGGADVQSVWSTAEAGMQAEKAKLFSIRIRDLKAEQKQAKMRADFIALLREQQLYGTLELTTVEKEPEAWDFTLHLARPISPLALRDLLARRRFTESDIRRITLMDKEKERLPSEFDVKLKASALETNPETQIAAVLDALESLIGQETVVVTIDPVTTEDATRAEGAAVGRRYVPIHLAGTRSTEAVRQAIYRDILKIKPGDTVPEDLRVLGFGKDAGSEIGRDMAVYGKDDDLDTIARSKETHLRVMSFTEPATGELHITLHDPQPQTALQDMLDARPRMDIVRSIVPLNVEGQDYYVSMAPLSEEKTIEKIKQDLVTEFKPELTPESAEQAVTVEIAPAPAPEWAAEMAPGAQFFKLTLSQPVQLQQIHATLVSAGYGDALVVQGNINTIAVGKAQTKEAYLRLTGSADQVTAAQKAIKEAVTQRLNDPFRSIETIGSAVAGETRNKAVLAILMSWVAMIFYLWFRFGESKFGLATVIALVHDVCFTLGAVGVADALSGTPVGNFLGFSDIKVNLTMIAAFLTLMGYSANDTIVVFDRIRENMGGVRRRVDAALVDTSVNQTLSRTVLTSLTVLFVVVVLYIMGGPVIHGFAFVMTVGVIVGTYSSIFIASPILIGWESAAASLKKLVRIVTFR